MLDYRPKVKSDHTKFAGRWTKSVRAAKIKGPVQDGYNVRQTPKLSSKVTQGAETALKPTKVYTGDKMIGIAIMHKSCLQPIFSDSEAKESASMRR